MKELETKLRRGMTVNGIRLQAQEEIVQSIASFALYGFPESHAASFALIAYASAYLSATIWPAFTAAMLNNQPWAFTSVDVGERCAASRTTGDPSTCCTPTGFARLSRKLAKNLKLLPKKETIRMRLGYSMPEDCGKKREKPWSTPADSAVRFHPQSRAACAGVAKSDLTMLARVGALNSWRGHLIVATRFWQVEYAGRPAARCCASCRNPSK